MRCLLFIFFTIIYNIISYAQDDLGSVVASPNRSLMELDKVGSSVYLIQKEKIENSSSTTTSGLLQEFSGFTIATKGNKGVDPSYFNRGLSRKYIRVLVDGIDFSDISAAGEEPTFLDYININNTDNIEILNGSQGTLYGSNAIGGVISINSSKPEKKGFQNETLAEGGTYSSIKTSNSLTYLDNTYSLVVNIDGERSNGYSAFNYDKQPLEKDGYYLYGSSLLSSININDNLEFNFNARYNNQHNEYDNTYAYPGDSTVYYRYDKQYGALFNLIYTDNSSLSHKITYQPTYTNRINVIGGRYEYDGSRKRLEYLLSADLTKDANLLTGLEFMKLNTNIEGLPSEKEVNSIFTELRLKPFNKTNVAISIRRENDSYYNYFDTARLQLNQKVQDNIIFRTSIGSGFRAPTASQLFNKTYGNKDLKPEKSLSVDSSIELEIPNYFTKLYFEVFENNIEDIITAPAPTYINQQSIESLKTKGVESRIISKIHSNLEFQMSHARTLGKQADGDSITLVPKDKLLFSINTNIRKNLKLYTSYLFQNKSKDLKYNELPVYKSLNLNLSYKDKNDSRYYIKLENILDRLNVVNTAGTSSSNLGFQSPGRSVYFGVKFKN